jgi:hypothetical protein
MVDVEPFDVALKIAEQPKVEDERGIQISKAFADFHYLNVVLDRLPLAEHDEELLEGVLVDIERKGVL